MTERGEVTRERKLVRARQRTIDDLPTWAKCCPAMIKRCSHPKIIDFTAVLSTFTAEARCPHCGRIKSDLLYRRTVAPIKTVIAVDMYKWDEGLEASR